MGASNPCSRCLPSNPPPLLSFSTPQVPDSLTPGLEARLAFLPASPHLLAYTSPCLGREALIYDYKSRQPLRTLQLPSPPASLAVPACPQAVRCRSSAIQSVQAGKQGLVAFGLQDGGVLVADSEAEASTVLTGAARAVSAVAFGARGRVVAGAGDLMWVWQRDWLTEGR